MGTGAHSDNELQQAELDPVSPSSPPHPSATAATNDDEKLPIQRTNSRAPYSVHSKTVKRLLVLGAACTALFSPISAQIYLPALIPIAHSLRVSAAQVNLTITTYMVFQGVTPMFVGSLADAGGRRPAYVACFVVYLAANVGLALAPNYAAVLALRCLQSAGSSSTVALCTAVVADVVTSAERGQYVGFTVLPTVLAPSLGPVLGGVLSQYLGWRSIFWFLAISAGVALVLILAFLPETCRRIVGDGSVPPPPIYRSGLQVIRLRKENRRAEEEAPDLEGASGAPPSEATEAKFKFKPPNVLEAVMMLFRRSSGLLLWSSSIIFAGFYCISAAMPALFHSRYHLDETQVGLMYLPIAGGSIVAALVVGRGMTWNYKRYCALAGVTFDRSRQMDMSDFPIERARLEIGIPLMLLAGTCLIAWGWAVHFHAHIAVLCVIMFFLGIGLIGMTNSMNVLLVDMHPGKAGTATAANNLTRCLVGAGATAAIVPLERAIGVGKAFSIVGSLFFICLTPLALLAFKGAGVRGYEKSDFYLATALMRPRIDWRFKVDFEDNLDLLSEMDMHRYRLQRRLIGRVYRTANVLRHEQALDRALGDVVGRLTSIKGVEIDLTEWMHIIAVESLGAVVLSWSPGMIKAGTDRDTSNQSYLGWRRKSVFGLFPLITKLEVNYKWIGRIFGTLWGITYQTPKGFKPFFPEVSRKVARRIKNASNPTAGQRQDLLADLIKLHEDKPEFTEMYLRKMAITNFGAGHETLASTLTAVMAMLGAHPDVQEEARREIRSKKAAKPQKPGSCIAYTDCLELLYTRAVIREAMRLYPVIGMSLPRVVPRHGSGLNLHSFHIPPGTTVGCNPVALHRNQDICGPNPDAFDPRRWVVSGSSSAEIDEGRVRALERYSLNWGGGSRTCPGRQVAEMIVLKCVVCLLERFEVLTADPVPEDHGPTYFLAMLTGVRVRFLSTEEGGLK
ncbi:general substrate transporter [Cordyceps fumosorosea ARSEF 2679]|uniref:General substrate transporter n=1 Tax=Cordyceps fumosorosea (strain ARSEF 2679) TaxID=1081104 RepID=A0A168ASA9_CORFA|nr:general substrate transporter [Cordyceps fumosorosea ARSEF 2679]OAA69128.1 general substrate transporter [Cordyceps fumosorosea ARSEF 2679]